MMVSADELLEVIDCVYAAPLMPGGWERALSSISELFGATATTYTGSLANAPKFKPTFVFTDRPNEEAATEYKDYYFSICERGRLSRLEPVGTVYYDHKYVSDAQIAKSEYYEFMARHDGKFAMGTTLGKPGGAIADLQGTQQCAVHFSDVHGHPDPETIATFGRLVPHLVRANHLRQRINADRTLADGVISALDQLPDAVFGLDFDAKVIFANSKARRLLSWDDGLRMGNGRLRLDDPIGQKKLVIELKNAMTEDALISAHAASLLSAERPSGERPFVLSVTRVELPESEFETSFQSAICFLVLVSESGSQLDILPTELCQVFGLTASEGQLTLALANGMSLAEYCRSSQISMETARWHLSNVFSKTNTNRQSELVRLISSLSVLKR